VLLCRDISQFIARKLFAFPLGGQVDGIAGSSVSHVFAAGHFHRRQQHKTFSVDLKN